MSILEMIALQQGSEKSLRWFNSQPKVLEELPKEQPIDWILLGELYERRWPETKPTPHFRRPRTAVVPAWHLED
jgi:hypothetical protein